MPQPPCAARRRAAKPETARSENSAATSVHAFPDARAITDDPIAPDRLGIELAGWYRQYGVSECWLIDVRSRSVEVFELQSTTPARMFSGEQVVRSAVLPDWAVPAEQIFD